MCGCIRAIAICSLVFQITTVAQLAVPTYSPGSGLYANTQVVTITSSTRGATIRFTTDGSAPTPTNGTFYAAPLSIATTTTLKAVAYKKGMTQSPVSYASYIINDYVRQAIDVVNKMSLDEKIAQVHGWGNRSIAGSMNAPLYYLTNGPAGVGHAGTNHGGPATALPAPIALAATFDTAMARVFGAIAGGEAHAYSNAMIEAPCVNIAR
ncbi:MAG: chitobiase/beta-hexosaminidase C-terminal domain-containing protein, partial [Ignavibacteriales bacterium]|nr:chitobiase/beta-hexosaminidase C-terminal domain-containing protein [Ignavibacteriales bacterium]